MGGVDDLFTVLHSNSKLYTYCNCGRWFKNQYNLEISNLPLTEHVVSHRSKEQTLHSKIPVMGSSVEKIQN